MMIVTKAKNIIVGIADMKVSNDPDSSLITYSLGSCLGIVIYDPIVKVGGILHAMLPESKDDKNAKDFNPYKFVDTGVPQLFKEAYKYGADKKRMIVAVTGGAQILDDSGYFNIGKRNLATMRKLFWKNGVMIDKEHVEGNFSRTVKIDISDGLITIKLGGGREITL
jgi:chemotaxis protein CheD